MKAIYVILLAVLINQSIADPLTSAENDHRLKICGIKPGKAQRKMLGGELIEPNEAPWAVGISWTSDDTPEPAEWSTCSGTLISSRHVVTAASCVIFLTYPDANRETYFVINENKLKGYKLKFHAKSGILGSVTENDPLDTIGAKRVFVPRLYKQRILSGIVVFELERDIAELMPGRATTEIATVCLHEYFPKLGVEVDMYGYGGDENLLNSNKFGLLQHIKTKVSNCTDSYVRRLSLEDRHDEFCTLADQHPCSDGDTGAGSIIYFTGRYSIVGVFSPEIDCDLLAQPGFLPGSMDYHVAISAHSKWICRKTGVCPYGHITVHPNPNSDDLVEAIEIGGTKTEVACDDESYVLASKGTEALCFKVSVHVRGSTSIDQAQKYCESQGAYLAPARNEEERKAIVVAAARVWEGPRKDQQIIIGGLLDKEINRFRWIYDNSLVSMDTELWLEGNPSKVEGRGTAAERPEEHMTAAWYPYIDDTPMEIRFNDVSTEYLDSAATACAKKATSRIIS